jgi:enoyl-CoA hydratase
MDLVLTGRPVAADEAHGMGLVNRLAPSGTALEVAVGLAKDLAALPQTCMRHDRLSILEQWGLVEGEAMASELAHGLVSLEYDALVGAGRFVAGAGRHGAASGSPSGARERASEQAPTRHKAPHQSDEKP